MDDNLGNDPGVISFNKGDEFENTVTTFLHISNKNGEVLNIVEVFKIDDEGRVFEIWAL